MLGKDLYKIEADFELSNDRLRSLVFFYGPLLGHDALLLYQYLVLRGSTASFEELNDLLTSLNISIDLYENQCEKLNEYRLLKTLKQDNRYIFQFAEPLERKQFIKDSLLVRDFILKTSGVHYQELIADIYDESAHVGFVDVSKKPDSERLEDWSKDNETYLKKNFDKDYDFATSFDVNVFLKNISVNLLPMRFRTNENMEELARMADIYGISYEKMRSFLPKIAKRDSDDFDLKMLRYLCANNAVNHVKAEDGDYGLPCVQYLMSLQEGKEVTDYDKKIIYNLSHDYHLNVPVINVLLRHALRNCDNRLIEKYLYPIASDLHRNNISSAKQALERLDRNYGKKQEDHLPEYDTSVNKKLSKQEIDELLSLKD